MKIFYATDVHGSDICWKKFINAGPFYEVDAIILGGDMTGKAVIPIISQGSNRWKVTVQEQESILEGMEEVDRMVQSIRNRGYYPYVTDPDETAAISSDQALSDKVFMKEVIGTLERWLDYADQKLAGKSMKCYVCPGNDDSFEIDEVIKTSKCVENIEGHVIQLDKDHEMISSGWTNPTPWDTEREEDEASLEIRFETMASQLKNPQSAVFNLHAPPYSSGLDDAPELTSDMRLAYAGQSLVPVGSKSTLKVIEKYGPILGLHGHIHEGRGSRKIQKTLCINAGSMYEQGILLGAVIELKPKKVGNYILTSG
jgi:Icc-related predicted phosphoesterase